MAGFSDATTGPADVQVVPHPAVMMVVDIGGGLLVNDASGRQHRGSVAAGLAPVGAAGRGPQDFECLQVRLSPLTADGVLGGVADLSGTVVALDDLWGARRCAYRSGCVRPRRGRTGSRSRRPRWPGGTRPAGWLPRRLPSPVRAQIGLTPKHAARLVRFDHAARLLAEGRSAAVVAADSGYADQSHLHRDVVAFAGMTPAAMAVTPFLAVDDVAWPDAVSAART